MFSSSALGVQLDLLSPFLVPIRSYVVAITATARCRAQAHWNTLRVLWAGVPTEPVGLVVQAASGPAV